MGITSNDRITAQELNTLKSNIKTLYNNRPLLNNNQRNKYAATALDNTQFVQYTKDQITPLAADNNKNHSLLGDLINACLVINDIPNLKYVDIDSSDDFIKLYDKIFGDGTFIDLIQWTNQYKNATGDSDAHGCRGACSGICSGGCSGTNKGIIGENSGTKTGGYTAYFCGCGNADCTSGCGSNCYNSCGQSAYMGCGTQCDNTCGVKCDTYCYGECKNQCGGTSCKNACYACDGCFGNCYESCGSGCGRSCSGCGHQCGNGCNTQCTTNCYGACKDSCGENSCYTQCYSGCQGDCEGICSDSCGEGCKDGCYGHAKGISTPSGTIVYCYGCNVTCSGTSTS